MPESATQRKLRQFERQNWAPASYRQLHPELKKLIHELRFRPGIKRCYQNCQYILLEAQYTPLEPRLAYHEGLVRCCGVPLDHAWLTLDGTVQDPTISRARSEDYLASLTYTAEQVRHNAQTTGRWMPVDNAALIALFVTAIQTSD